MNWHVRVVGGLIVLLFAGFSFYYFKLYVTPKKHGVILFAAPGVSEEVLREASKKGFKALNKGKQTTLVRSGANDDYASLMTRVASGKKGLPGQLGLDKDGKRLDTLLYQAQKRHRVVGVVSSGSLASPGVAAFFSHIKNAFAEDEVILQVLDSTDINLVLGGGRTAFTEAYRKHDRNLLEEAEAKGYQIIHNKEELGRMQAWLPRNVLGVFPKAEISFRSAPIKEVPSLTTMTRRAIQKLQYHIGGYFLVIEHGLTAEADEDEVVLEMMELDRAVKTALAYAGKNTLVMVFFPSSEMSFLFLYGEISSEFKNLITPEKMHDLILEEL